jgi:hypothetical protein
MLHWAMRFVLHQHTAMAIEVAGRQGALFPIVICLNINIATGPCYSLFKLLPSYKIDLIGVISLFVVIGCCQQQLMLFQPPLLLVDEPNLRTHRG